MVSERGNMGAAKIDRYPVRPRKIMFGCSIRRLNIEPYALSQWE